MVGKVVAQYQISEKLGEGGMGRGVESTHLDRFVALKTLTAERLADLERKRRFVQEAKAASALNHSNIVHIYDIAEADSVQFIAMEYVAGKTLDQLIGGKGLRLNEALKYEVQIADALARAHAAGIIHRDLKPSNIMVTENGLVKVLFRAGQAERDCNRRVGRDRDNKSEGRSRYGRRRDRGDDRLHVAEAG